MQHRSSLVLLAFIAALPGSALPQETDYEVGGHIKGRLLGQSFPDNSVFNQLAGDTSLDGESDLRLNFEASKGRWSFDAAYQLFAGYGDRVNPAGLLPGGSGNSLPNDDRRLFKIGRAHV